jgi:hypothetical protein
MQKLIHLSMPIFLLRKDLKNKKQGHHTCGMIEAIVHPKSIIFQKDVFCVCPNTYLILLCSPKEVLGRKGSQGPKTARKIY